MVKRHFLLLIMMIFGASIQAGDAVQGGSGPIVNLNEADYRDKVLACWMGKAIGGTLGMPFEGDPALVELSFYTDLEKLKGGAAPNDDLDLQIMLLKAMEEHGGRVDARLLGEYWMKYVPVNWNEFGDCKRNMRLGILPPLSGEFNNARWKHSNGAWIRSEIWACLAPGSPALAARLAREDACVDHGAGEGTLAAIYMAALESAAFIEHDRDKLIAIGLSMIPKECGTARAIRAALAAHQAGKDWKAARLDVIAASEATGWFQAPRNVAYTMLGWLYSEGDFGKSLCIAVGCGDDTDCTGATLGAIFGIIGGTKAIPERWSKPIGNKIRTIAIGGFEAPEDLEALTERTLAMAKRMTSIHGTPVAITPEPANLRRAGELKLADPGAVRDLWTISPYRIVWNEPEGTIILDYVKDPVIAPGRPHPVRVTLRNNMDQEGAVTMSLKGLPPGWKLEGLPAEAIRIAGRESKTMTLTFTADAVEKHYYRMALEFPARDRIVSAPLTLVNRDIVQTGKK